LEAPLRFERVEEKCVAVFRPYPFSDIEIDHVHDFGTIRFQNHRDLASQRPAALPSTDYFVDALLRSIDPRRISAHGSKGDAAAVGQASVW
jgi:hypothetical protein